MTDPLETIAAVVAALIAEDPHSLADTTLLTSTESLLTTINQFHGVVASRLQFVNCCGRSNAAYSSQIRWLGRQPGSVDRGVGGGG